jgi:hypothetical protein
MHYIINGSKYLKNREPSVKNFIILFIIYMRHFKLNIFNKNYKYISESESSENLLSSVENTELDISPNNKNQLVKKDSTEFSDFEQAVILDNDFAKFDEQVFIEDIDCNKDEVKKTVEYLINYCEDFYTEYKYELHGYISNLLYNENKIAYVVRVNDPEQFRQFKIKTYNMIGIEGIFYWNENTLVKINDKVLVECTYIGNRCQYKLNKIIRPILIS